MRILIVDDELVSRVKMKKIMARYGDCDEACNGGQALKMIAAARIRDRPYALVMLDVNMPEMNGLEVLKTIRAEETDLHGQSLAPMKVVMVTSMADRDIFADSLFEGCDDYIIKPFDPGCIERQMRILGITPHNSGVADEVRFGNAF